MALALSLSHGRIPGVLRDGGPSDQL